MPNSYQKPSNKIEFAVAGWFGIRTHVIVPNLSWGLVRHECDLAVLSPSDYLYEIEIKVSRGDIIRDRNKEKWRVYDERGFRKLWFAIPDKLQSSIEHIPERAGILIITENNGYSLVREIRKPIINKLAKKLSQEEKFNLARLGAMRIWKLKHALLNINSNGRGE